MLNRRQREVLAALVETYLSSGEPVSSQTIASLRSGPGYSGASVRNTLRELTELGFVDQLHSRSGRFPTKQGMRRFLDGGGAGSKLHPWDRTRLDAAAKGTSISKLPGHLSHTLAELTGELAVVGVPRFVGRTFREVGLVRYGVGRFLIYFVSPGGGLQQKLVEVEFDLDGEELQRVQNFLNERLTHRTLTEVREQIRLELVAARNERDRLRRNAIEIGLRGLPDPELELTVEGAGHLAEKPEFHDAATLRRVLQAVESQGALLTLLDRIIEGTDVTVVLGSEHEVREIAALSCVAGACAGPDGSQAAIGLLGPVRMDYGRLVALVRHAKLLFERRWNSF